MIKGSRRDIQSLFDRENNNEEVNGTPKKIRKMNREEAEKLLRGYKLLKERYKRAFDYQKSEIIQFDFKEVHNSHLSAMKYGIKVLKQRIIKTMTGEIDEI